MDNELLTVRRPIEDENLHEAVIVLVFKERLDDRGLELLERMLQSHLPGVII